MLRTIISDSFSSLIILSANSADCSQIARSAAKAVAKTLSKPILFKIAFNIPFLYYVLFGTYQYIGIKNFMVVLWNGFMNNCKETKFSTEEMVV